MPDFRTQRVIYNGFVLPIAYGALSLVAPFHRKLRETFAGRRNLRDRWSAAGKRLKKRPVWFHVASVGEYEQARPVISMLNERFPDIPIVISFMSPSGYRFALERESVGNGSNVAFFDYLPPDFAGNARFCLETLNPRLLVFVKFDLWPNLIWQSVAQRVPVVLIDATLSTSSHRLTGVGMAFYRAVYSKIEKILAISRLDAGRFESCVPGHGGISVAGDTRFDRVMERKRRKTTHSIRVDKAGRFCVIAGSTWPKDEASLLEAFARLAATHRDILLIIAPHEPAPERIDDIRRWAHENHIETATLDGDGGLPPPNGAPQALLVDRVGVLAELYRFADAAYIGGSFSSGVHSVIEPAIMGIPVLFGPRHTNSFEALELVERGAARVVRSAEEIHRTLTSIMAHEDERKDMGERAREYVESQLGASGRCMEAITPYL